MKTLNCYILKPNDHYIDMIRCVDSKTLQHIDIPIPHGHSYSTRLFFLANASLLGGEDHVDYDCYFLFNIHSNGRMEPHTCWLGNDTGFAVGFDKSHNLLYFDTETNEIKERFDLDYENCYKKKTE